MSGDFTAHGLYFLSLPGPGPVSYLACPTEGVGNGPILVQKCDGTKGIGVREPCNCGGWFGQNTADNKTSFQLHGFASAEEAGRATQDETIKRMTLGGGSDVGTT